jgi:hypothetical protein
MKKTLVILFILLVQGVNSFAQNIMDQSEEIKFESRAEAKHWEKGQESTYDLFRAVDAREDISEEKWFDLLSDLDQKQAKKGNGIALLRSIFEKSHRSLFKKYEQHSSFNAVLTEGKFDCVSGSAALGMLLNRYRFNFEIIETDYHVFIVVNFEDENIIFESTLPVGGMITSQNQVLNYLESYKPTTTAQFYTLNQRLGDPDRVLDDKSIFRKVSLTQLAGLQYYNDAISHFNEQYFATASLQLNKALALYPSERIEELKSLAIEQAYKTFGKDIK